MPISDASYMLATTIADGDGTGVHTGPGPHEGMLLRTYFPAALTSATLTLQHSDDDGDADAYAAIEDQQATDFVAGATELTRCFWTKAWLRVVMSSTVGTGTGATVGIVQGTIPTV